MTAERIKEGFAHHEWCNERLDGLDVPRDRRIMMTIACADQALEHHVAIMRLLDSRIYGSAFALVRPIYESFVRGVWLYRCAEEVQLDRYEAENHQVHFNEMVEQIETSSPFDVRVLSNLKKQAWGAMNSYTHSGYRQLGRRFSGSEVRPSYEADEIDEVAKLTNWVSLLSFQHIVVVLGRDDLANEVLERFKQTH